MDFTIPLALKGILSHVLTVAAECDLPPSCPHPIFPAYARKENEAEASRIDQSVSGQWLCISRDGRYLRNPPSVYAEEIALGLVIGIFLGSGGQLPRRVASFKGEPASHNWGIPFAGIMSRPGSGASTERSGIAMTISTIGIPDFARQVKSIALAVSILASLHLCIPSYIR
jgi:hypothetical protein